MNFGDPTTHIQVVNRVVAGDVHAIWVKTCTLPHFESGRYASCDDKVTCFDFSPRYQDSANSLVFTPREDTDNGSYLLMEIWLESWESMMTGSGEKTTVFQWHQVDYEKTVVMKAPIGVSSMQRSNHKLNGPKKAYVLLDGRRVLEHRIVARRRKSEFPKLTLLNGTKFILEIDWDMGMDLNGGENE